MSASSWSAGEKVASIFEVADAGLQTIARDIIGGKKFPPGFAPLSRFLKLITYGKFVKDVQESRQDFSVSDDCTGCGRITLQ